MGKGQGPLSDESIQIFEDAINQAKMDSKERINANKRLSDFLK